MKSIGNSIVILSLFYFGLIGCARQSVFPVHDEVLTFPLPMDLTYLRTLEAIQAHPDWDLDRTVKEEGLIYIRNLRYSSYADADQRMATLVLKPIGPHETSVQFAPESQAVVGGDEVLDLIKQYLSAEVSRR